jgi:formylmethanofuran dehydrogenase subunit B
VVLDPFLSETAKSARVAITTAVYGINVPGTVYRMDDVPIRLRPALPSRYPSDEEVLKRIVRRVRELSGAAVPA